MSGRRGGDKIVPRRLSLIGIWRKELLWQDKGWLRSPTHLHTVTPRIVVGNGTAAIAFYERCFGAELVGGRFDGRDGRLIHAELRIGDSVVMLTEDNADGPIASPDRVGGLVTCLLATYWKDVDQAWQRAVEAGAEILFPLETQFYGERGGRLRDPFGQQWMMSQHIEDVSPEELAHRAAAFFETLAPPTGSEDCDGR